jgi:serine/threonine-protein kinase
LLAEGSKARIYEGRDLLLGRHVAIKVSRGKPTNGDPSALLREARRQATTPSPNQPRIYAAGVERGLEFLVVELLRAARNKTRTEPAALSHELPEAPDLPPAPPPQLAQGSVVAGHYRIRGLLGRGAMGTVYAADHLGLDKTVALKMLPPSPTHDVALRFEREARATARLDHPGCVRVLDYGTTSGRLHYLVMEMLDGPTLCETLTRRGRLSLDEGLGLIAEVLSALTHAHQREILHRDIKPSNLVFTQRGEERRLVLIDFGIAQLRDLTTITAQNVVPGSPSYIAPERFLMQEYDERADLYSVGVVLYEALAGVRPFVGANPIEIARRHLGSSPTPLSEARPDAPPELEGLVSRALARDPARRFANASEMLGAVELTRMRLAARAAGEIRSETPSTRQDETPCTAEIVVWRESLWRRFWAWVLFGLLRWRISHSAPHVRKVKLTPQPADRTPVSLPSLARARLARSPEGDRPS